MGIGVLIVAIGLIYKKRKNLKKIIMDYKNKIRHRNIEDNMDFNI
jgi:hypothetical protein